MEIESTEFRRIDRIGCRIYIWPKDPDVGDFEALKKWKPKRLSFINSIIFILKQRKHKVN